jgi:hypothetical protein
VEKDAEIKELEDEDLLINKNIILIKYILIN